MAKETSIAMAKPSIVKVGELIKSSLADYFKNWQKFLALLLVPFMLSWVLSIFSIFFRNYSNSLSWPLALILIVAALLLMILFFVLYLISLIAELLLIQDLTQKINWSWTEIKTWYGKSKPLFWPVLLVSAVYAIAVIFGLIVFIIPGLFIMTSYLFAIYFVVFEADKLEGAFLKSRELVRGYRWAVFGRLVLGVVLVYAVSFLLLFVSWGIFWLVGYFGHLQSWYAAGNDFYNIAI